MAGRTRDMKRLALLVAATVAAAWYAGLGLQAQTEGEYTTMADLDIEYGFRHDPMDWVNECTSLEAALVRKDVLSQPKPGDEAILQKRIDEILAQQGEDGALSGHPLHAVTQTGKSIREAIELGAAPDDPRIKRAAEYVLRHNGVDEEGEALSLGMAQALRLVGLADESAVRDAARREIARADEWIHPWCGCPWTPVRPLKELWAAREADGGVLDVIARGLHGIAPKLNEAGCLDFNDPWGYLDLAGTVDHPLGREIAVKQIPMVLRSQQKDGGWGEESLTVFRVLVKYDLLTPLRELDPLPPDWEVVRSIPAPAGELFSLAWDGERLWVYDTEANEAIALSPMDGRALQRLTLPVQHVRAIGWWDGDLAVTQQLPTERGWTSEEDTRRLLRVNTKTGEVEREIVLPDMHNIHGVVQADGQLVVADGFLNAVGIFDAADPREPRHCTLGSPGTIELAAQDGTVWHSDWLLTEIIFRSDLEGRLLDWGTKPFDGDLKGLAWDGDQLWALDTARGLVLALRRTAGPSST
jgi:hypothetical protein